MNFSKALELLKQGKKVRRKVWKKSTKIFIRNEQLFVDNDEEECNYANTSVYYILSDILADDWEEYKEPLLTKEEKEYLKMIIKFNLFKVKTVEITRPDPCWDDRHFILLRGYNDDEDDSANFIKPNYFKNLKNTKPYTLKELGLEKE